MFQPWQCVCPFTELFDYFLGLYARNRIIDPQIKKGLNFRDFQNVSRTVSLMMNNDILNPKDVVHFIGPNSLALCVCWCAVVYSDWIPVGSNSTIPLTDLQMRINNTCSKALVLSSDLAHTLLPKLDRKKIPIVFAYEVLNIDSSEQFKIDITEYRYSYENVAVWEYDLNLLRKTSFMLMTSGTTGFPKAVMVSHRSIMEQMNTLSSIYENSKLKSQITFIFCNHLSHSGGILTFIMGIFSGRNIIIMDGFDPKMYLDAFIKYNCNYIVCTPAMLILLSKFSDLSNYDLSNTQTIVCGGEKINRKIINIVKQSTKMNNCVEFFQVYDSCECPMTHYTQSRLDSVKEYLDAPHSSVQCKIINIDTNMESNFHEDGELWIKAPSTMLGYFDDKKKTNSVLTEDFWYKTGDIGHFDESGKLYVSGRLSKIVRLKEFGKKYAELEDVILQHPAVKMAAVVGKLNEMDLDGQAVAVAVIEKTSGATRQEIMDFVNQHARHSKKIRAVYVRDKIPLNNGYKVDRITLQNLVNNEESIICNMLYCCKH